MLKLAVIFALALGCHGANVPSIKLEDGEIPTFQVERYSPEPVYILHTRDNPWQGTVVVPTTLTGRKTIILVHGHGGSSTTSLNPDVRNAILQREDVNVILMDWQGWATGSYSQALNQVDRAAQHLRAFLESISADTNPVVARSDIQIVGFNLGAHLAGIAARGLRIARITGLDPSRDGWGPRTGRLSDGDAVYVEVIHTDGGPLGNGIGEAIGRADFFVNGGIDQPGCFNRLCSHNFAYVVFAASINNVLIGSQCDSTTQINLNSCRGVTHPMGNIDSNKPWTFGMFRANVGRPPF